MTRHSRRRTVRRSAPALAALGAVLLGTALGACGDAAVDPIDAPRSDAIQGALTRRTLDQLATGVVAQDRVSHTTFAYILFPAIFGRDAYRIDPSENRYVTETLGGSPDPGSFVGGGGWTPAYTAIRAATTLLDALPSAPESQISAAERGATAGFLRTMRALNYYRILELRDSIGLAIQGGADEETPIRCKPAVLAYVRSQLDSANAELAAAGADAELPFALPSGFTSNGRDYGVVANLVLFNRGLKGKVDLYAGLSRQGGEPALIPQAVAELTEALGGAAPGAVAGATLASGVYHVYVPGGSEAFPNPFSDPRILANPLAHDSLQPGDARAAKIVARSGGTFTSQGLASAYTFAATVPSTANESRPLPVLKDEELVLLRAQAFIETGRLAEAAADLNSVRTFYGLAPYAAFASQAAARDALLYEKRYSLLLEGPQRLVDLRAYGLLDAEHFRRELPTDLFNTALPIPAAEVAARGGGALACEP